MRLGLVPGKPSAPCTPSLPRLVSSHQRCSCQPVITLGAPPPSPPYFQTNHAASSATTPSTHAPALSNTSAPALSVAMWMYNNPYFLPALRIAIEPLTFLFLTLGFKSWSCTGKPSSSHGNNLRSETTLKDCSPLVTMHVPHASSPATSCKA